MIMNIKNIFSLIFKVLVLLQFIKKGYGVRTKDKMYEKIDGTSACYRRLNATHQVGCTSKWGGSTGVIHFCENKSDLVEIITNGTSPPYIPILPSKLFTSETLKLIIGSNKVSGLIIHSNNETLEVIGNFTHEYQCPNPQSSLDGTCKQDSVWNPLGTGLLYADIPFPIFYVDNDENIHSIRNCFNKFNNYSYSEQTSRPLCSLQLTSFMYATTNTPTCRRRSDIITTLNPVKFCDPLGDSNIWASLYPLVEGPNINETKPIKDYKYIVVAARLDTTSFFEKTTGANNPSTGIVSLLSLAKFLNSTVSQEDVLKAKKNVLFFLFNGESYDYIGSQRMLYDMSLGNFPVDDVEGSDTLPPISVNNIDLFIELSQLGNAKKTLYIHYTDEDKAISNFTQRLYSYNGTSGISFENVPGSLPPASLHTFKKAVKNFPGLIISDHRTAYSNHFYNSIYDNSDNVQFKYYNMSKSDDKMSNESIQYFIKNVTEIIGKAIYSEITGVDYDGNETVDAILVNELLFCYLVNQNCLVHRAIHKHLKLPNAPMSLYVGVDRVENAATTLTALTLGWFTGDYAGPSDITCTNKPRNYAFKFYNMSASIYELNVTNCYKVTMNTTRAVSPAFNISGYDWSSGQYSTWTESTWAEITARMFLKPPPSQERTTLSVGCITMVFSLVLVYFIKSRSHILFTVPVPTEAPADC